MAGKTPQTHGLTTPQATVLEAICSLISAVAGGLIAGSFDIEKTERTGETKKTLAEIDQITKNVVKQSKVQKINIDREI